MSISPAGRRAFIVSALALATGAAIAAQLTPLEMKNKPQIVHHVFFWLKNPRSEADRSKLINGLRMLEKIETVRAIHIGVPAKTDPRPVVDASYSVSELLFFDDLEGQKIYQEHPVHQQFVTDHSGLWEKVTVYDTMII